MTRTRTIPIMNQVDIHAARMYTREAARLVGLELNEQAQVSMATSALADCLKMGAPARSALPSAPSRAANQIIISVIEPAVSATGGSGSEESALQTGSLQPAGVQTGALSARIRPAIGLQVDFESANVSDSDSIQVQLKRIQTMVDVIQTENLPSGALRVRIIKWGRQVVANSGPKE